MPIICAKTYLNTQIQADTKTLLFISWRHCLLLWNRHQVWIIWLGNLRRACTHTYTVPSLYKYVFPDVYVLFKWFGLTKRKHTVSFPCSWAVTVRSNRSCRLCWVFLIKNGLLLVASLLKTTDLSSHLHSVGHWSCVRLNMDAVIADVTLKLMSARVHPSWREKLPEESSLNTLWCRKHHTSLMPLRQAFRCPTGHLVANHLC